MSRRNRDAATGKMVTASEAAARPRETVSEQGNSALEKRVAVIEKVLSEDGGRLSDAFCRLSK